MCTFPMEENKRLSTRSGYCQRCACVVCMTSAISWPNCVLRVARISTSFPPIQHRGRTHQFEPAGSTQEERVLLLGGVIFLLEAGFLQTVEDDDGLREVVAGFHPSLLVKKRVAELMKVIHNTSKENLTNRRGKTR